MAVAVSLGFEALAYASVLYLLSVGLSVTLGLMGFVNLAHAVFAMAGGYLAAVGITQAGISWYAMLILAPLAVAAVAALLERLLYARLYQRDELDQVLFCIGLIFIAGALTRLAFGPLSRGIPIPAPLQRHLLMGGVDFYAYKLLVVAIGAATALAVLFGLERTRLGAMIRAAVENRGMAESVGLRTGTLFTATFALGGALGALGGIIGADIFQLSPSYAFDVLITVQIVVAVAGIGTLRGLFISALLIGLIQTLTAYYLPALGTIVLFAFLFVLLLARPKGLFGRI
jgi:branched-chain amino acid transport system permease protein